MSPDNHLSADMVTTLCGGPIGARRGELGRIDRLDVSDVKLAAYKRVGDVCRACLIVWAAAGRGAPSTGILSEDPPD